MMKTGNTFIQNLIRSVILLLCAAGVLLTPPQTAHADKPTINSVAITSTPNSNDYYGIGDRVQVTVTFSEAVVLGSMSFSLLVGDSSHTLTKSEREWHCNARFSYRFPRCWTVEMITMGFRRVTPLRASSELQNNVNDVSDLAYTPLSNVSGHKVDTTKPTVSSITLTSNAGDDKTYKKGDKIQVQVTFSEKVTVDTTKGTPQLTLKVGTADKTADYKSGSNSTQLVFEYTVASGDADTDGIEIEANKLALNSGTIKDVCRQRCHNHALRSHHKIRA